MNGQTPLSNDKQRLQNHHSSTAVERRQRFGLLGLRRAPGLRNLNYHNLYSTFDVCIPLHELEVH
jgi:hypothetical protein